MKGVTKFTIVAAEPSGKGKRKDDAGTNHQKGKRKPGSAKAKTPEVEADAALVSRPRRSLRNTEKAKENTAVTKTVKIISKRPARKWDAERLLTDPKSPLAKADLRSLLSSPMAWASLDDADKDEVLALFPDQRHIFTENDGTARPDMESLLNDDSFRHDCAAYTESLVQGRHDPDWLSQAWAAHERRKAGDFDEYLRDKFEHDWGVKLPEDEEAEDSAGDKTAEGQDGKNSQSE